MPNFGATSFLLITLIGAIGCASLPFIAHPNSPSNHLDDDSGSYTLTGDANEDDYDYEQEALSEDLEQLPVQHLWKRTFAPLTTKPSTPQPTATFKNGFWPLHPSELAAPMRRPPKSTKFGGSHRPINSFGIGRRSAQKKSSHSESPYHPLPRSVAQKNRGHHNGQQPVEETTVENNTLESSGETGYTLAKRQSPGSYLLLKLSRINRVLPTNPGDGRTVKLNQSGRDTNQSTYN